MKLPPISPGNNPDNEVTAATSRLRAALNDTDRYLLTTDDERTHDRFVGLAIQLVGRGVRPESLSFGCVQVLTSTGARLLLSFLSFPRPAVHPREFHRWGCGFGSWPDRFDPRRNILVVTTSRPLVAHVLAAIAEGEGHVLRPQPNN